MPWCPKCKAEYQKGFTVCSDCNVELVEKLEESQSLGLEPFFQSEDKKVAEKLVKFFQYSELYCELNYDETNEFYVISIPPQQEKNARKLYQAFYEVESSRIANSKNGMTSDTSKDADDSDESMEDSSSLPEEADKYPDLETDDDSSMEDEAIEDASNEDITSYEANNHDSVYVMKADEYKDLAGSVWIFLFFGIGGLIFVLLNVAGVISVFNGWIPNLVMGALFLLFIYIALSTNKKAKKIQSEIIAENKLTDEINQWLKLNITESYLSSINDESLSEEINYITKLDIIKEMLLKEFGPQNLAYLDRLIDEFYNSNFDREEE